MSTTILCLNLGSSSLKYALYESMAKKDVGEVDAKDEPLEAIKAKIGDVKLAAIAHRIVHGGPEFTDHCLITPDVIAGLKKISDLAPNHLSPEIALIEEAQKAFPNIPHIACFDTVFHRDMPDVAKRLPLPRKLEIRRYGFHGLSYTYIMNRLPDFIGDRAQGRIIIAHLGSGASMAAVKGSKPVDTTMGMTPLGGLVMATRAGDLDPGIQLYLEKTQNINSTAYEHMVYAQSGLLGISETSKDIRDLLANENNDPRAAEAVAAFCYSAKKWIGALAATLEGLDVLVFTGGIGQHSPAIRQRICDDLGWLGLTLDMNANAAGEQCISAPHSKVLAFAMATDEEQVMAEITFHLCP